MERMPVSSSNISSIGYDPDLMVLEIEFHRGRVYQYQGVPIELYESLMQAPSHGRFFSAYIRNSGYPCVRIM